MAVGSSLRYTPHTYMLCSSHNTTPSVTSASLWSRPNGWFQKAGDMTPNSTSDVAVSHIMNLSTTQSSFHVQQLYPAIVRSLHSKLSATDAVARLTVPVQRLCKSEQDLIQLLLRGLPRWWLIRALRRYNLFFTFLIFGVTLSVLWRRYKNPCRITLGRTWDQLPYKAVWSLLHNRVNVVTRTTICTNSVEGNVISALTTF